MLAYFCDIGVQPIIALHGMKNIASYMMNNLINERLIYLTKIIHNYISCWTIVQIIKCKIKKRFLNNLLHVCSRIEAFDEQRNFQRVLEKKREYLHDCLGS